MGTKYWEIIAVQLSKAGWSWGYTTFRTPTRTMFVVDAHRGDGKRYIAQADEMLTAFLELERTLRETIL